MIKLSLVIPVYNVEKYIEKCLSSCLNQHNIDKSKYEIIVVNDGTLDNSMNIVHKMAHESERIRIFEQSNQGLSVARNVGMSHAVGDYIWFIDSDDWIEDDAISTLIEIIENEQPDVITINAKNSNSDKVRNVLPSLKTGKDILLCRGWKTPCAPFNIMRRNLLLENSLYFYEGIFHEDSEFTPRMLHYAQKCRICNKVCYNVYVNPQSITRTHNPKKSFDLIIVSNNLLAFMEQVKMDKDERKRFYYYIAVCIQSALSSIRFCKLEERKKFSLFFCKQKHLYPTLWKCHVSKYMVEYILFSIFPAHIVDLYTFFSHFNIKRS